MRFKAPFTLYKRSTQEGKVWCVSYYDDQGRRVRKSTGETSKTQAMKAALRMVTRQDQRCAYPAGVHQDVLRLGRVFLDQAAAREGERIQPAVGAESSGDAGQPRPAPLRLHEARRA